MKSWLRKFALACGTISLLVCACAAAPNQMPAVALVDPADLPQWQTWLNKTEWRVIAPSVEPNAGIDAHVQALEKAVRAEIQNGSADPARIYLAGRGADAAAVFYTVSRVPDLWAAAVALAGSPQQAIDSGRLYAANFANVPVLWVGAGEDDAATAERLRMAGMVLEYRAGAGVTSDAVIQWLAQHSLAEHPASIDCETNSPTFARCYWITLTKFDPAERNDVLASSRVQPTLSAALDLGGFGFKKDDPGPGVLVSYLPPKYAGPLKLGDRIVELDGREIPDARRYLEQMAQISEERPAVAAVQRGKDRIRLETRILLPAPAASVTARVQAQYLPEAKEIQIVSRTVTEMRVDVPAAWIPATLNWNGVPLATVETAGCRLLSIDKAIERSNACP